jgi:peptidoglycan/LPS O-acetylase OafA/YrhL
MVKSTKNLFALGKFPIGGHAVSGNAPGRAFKGLMMLEDPTVPQLPLSREMIPALTGVRALAAIWVVAGHFSSTWLTLCPALGFLKPLFYSATLGVDLFFGLSGFILAHNYLEDFQKVSPKPYCRFLGMRLARLYPVHLFTLLVLVVGVILGRLAHFQFNAPERLHFPEFLQNVFLVHMWKPNVAPSWNGPAWSISAEWFAYLLFPFLSLAVVKVRSNKAAIAGVLLPLLLLLATLIVTFAHPLLRIACEFTAGVFLYRLYQNNFAHHLNWSGIALGLMVTIVALVYLMHNHDPVAPLVVLFVFALSRAQTGIAWVLSLPLSVFIGEVSYSLYMTHDVVRMALKKLIPVEPLIERHWSVRFGVMALYIVTILLVAIGTHWLVEIRGRRALRRMVNRHFPAEPRPAGQDAAPANSGRSPVPVCVS